MISHHSLKKSTKKTIERTKTERSKVAHFRPLVRKSVQPYLDDLCRVKILHDSPESAANLVNEIYEDPLTWWMAPERQKVKDNFCYQFARTSKNFLEEWKAELLKLTN